MNQPEQSSGTQGAAFIQAARELGADVPEEHFDRALKAVASKRGEKPESQMHEMQRLMGTVAKPRSAKPKRKRPTDEPKETAMVRWDEGGKRPGSDKPAK